MVSVTVEYFNLVRDRLYAYCSQILNHLGRLPDANQTDQAFQDLRDRVTRLHTDVINSASQANPNPAIQSDATPGPKWPSPPDTRALLLGDADDARAAAQVLLGNLPNRLLPVNYQPMPLDQLFGQMLAIHNNSLLWLKHIDDNVSTVVRECESGPASWLPQVLSSVQQLTDSVRTLAAGQGETAQKLEQLLARPQLSLEGSVIQTLDTLNGILSEIARRPATSDPSANEAARLSANLALPPLTAAHPSQRCRTHGRILFDDIHSAIPMDVLNRPASSALELRLSITRLPTQSVVNATLYDASALLFSRVIDTPHSLRSLPGDALSLLHTVCPSFVYKLDRAGFR